MKNKEIPSTPSGKFKFKIGIQKNFSTNWNDPIDLLKNTHKHNELINVKHETLKATDLNSILFEWGINNKTNVPNNGRIKVKDNIFLIYNMIFKIFHILQDSNPWPAA